VETDNSERDTRLSSDVAYRNSVETELGEKPLCGVKNALASLASTYKTAILLFCLLQGQRQAFRRQYSELGV
jgi:hypothetical protein